jgi:ribosomal protein S18 acetylase RimI-like enzyme
MPDYKIEPLTKHNIEDLILFDKECFTENFAEDKESILNAARNYPKGSLLLYCGEKIVGSLFFHPYVEGQVHELNSPKTNFSGNENCMYLHSFSIHPDFRGKGLTHILFDHFNEVSLAEGYDLQALVAVQNSKRFWMRYGFKPIREINYSNAPSTYMTRKTVS